MVVVKRTRQIDHGTCTLSLSISRPSALSPIKRPRKHGQKQAGSSWASPSTSLSLSLFPAILLSLSLSLSISSIDYSFSAGSVYQSPRSYSSIFPLVYRLLWASLLPSVGPNPNSHIILSNDRASPRAYSSCIRGSAASFSPHTSGVHIGSIHSGAKSI